MQASREMTRPVFEANLRQLFPDLEALPHHDTRARLLARIEVSQIEQAHLATFQCNQGNGASVITHHFKRRPIAIHEHSRVKLDVGAYVLESERPPPIASVTIST